MDKGYKGIVLNHNAPLKNAIKIIDTNTYYNMTLVVDDENRFVGILTNGDVTRAMLSGASLEDPVSKVVNRNPVTLRKRDLNNLMAKMNVVGDLLKRQGIFVPVLNEENLIVNFIHYLDLELDISATKDKLSYATGKSVLVIGGAGYLGSVLVKNLLLRGYNVVCLDNFAHNNYAVCDFTKEHTNLKIIKADVRNVSHVVRSLEGMNVVIHLAAVVGDPACSNCPTDAIEINYLATKMIAEAAKYSQVNRFIFASTCSVYGQSDTIVDENSSLNPISLYAKSKIKSEQGILDMADDHFSPTIMRMSTLFGLSYRMRFDLVVNTLVMKAITERKITIFGGNQWRPFLHVVDAADAYVAVLEAPMKKIKGQVYNVGSERLNYQIYQLGAFIREVFPEIEVEIREDSMDVRNYQVSFQKIQKELNFYVTKTVDDAIREIADFLTKNKIEIKDPKYSNSALLYDNGMDLEDFVLA